MSVSETLFEQDRPLPARIGPRPARRPPKTVPEKEVKRGKVRVRRHEFDSSRARRPREFLRSPEQRASDASASGLFEHRDGRKMRRSGLVWFDDHKAEKAARRVGRAPRVLCHERRRTVHHPDRVVPRSRDGVLSESRRPEVPDERGVGR